MKLAKGIRSVSGSVQLEAKKARVVSRLSALKASAKITPAEVKKIDVARLSGESDATIDAVFKSYEDREPVILAGIMGSAKAETVSDLAQSIRMQQLEAETRANMSLKQATGGQAQSSGETDAERQASQVRMKRLSSLNDPEVNHMADGTDQGVPYDLAYGEICKMMDEGKGNEAKAAIKALLDKMASSKRMSSPTESVHLSRESEATISALAESVKCLQNQFEDLFRLVGSNLGVTASELE